ncbi:MAG: aspartate/glutamate racemase family protein [Acidobacteriota bacterium]
MSKRKIALVHTSPAAIGPLMQYYGEAAPELEITNLLDDGILRLFRRKDEATAFERLASLIEAARDAYCVELALVTCSSVSMGLLNRLRPKAGIPLLKIDEPMARLAVRSGRRVGIAVTFPPTLEPTSRLLTDAAQEAQVEITLVPELIDLAYEALLSARTAEHDRLLLDGMERLVRKNVDVIVLAQVSMARILPQAQERFSMPVLTSLDTSLSAVRAILK